MRIARLGTIKLDGYSEHCLLPDAVQAPILFLPSLAYPGFAEGERPAGYDHRGLWKEISAAIRPRN
jgi:hypothetical protein